MLFQSSRTGVHEEEFYLYSTCIELCGVEIVEMMRTTMDETFIGDARIAVRRVTEHQKIIADVIGELIEITVP